MRTCLSFLIASSTILAAQPDGREIIRRSISTADRNWKIRQSYTYMARDEERHMDSQGRVKSTDVDLSKAVPVNGDTIEQAVSHNGGPPTPAKRKKDEDTFRNCAMHEVITYSEYCAAQAIRVARTGNDVVAQAASGAM